jgi:2'-5' RNA ligase
MPPLTGLYVVAELQGSVAERIMEIQREFDPKLARFLSPHVTIAGSSGMGPIRPDVPVAELKARLEPVAASIAPMTLRFERPMRFMQTTVVVLPLSPNGPLRALHEAIKASGLPYAQPRFSFSPHATLSLYRELTPATERRLLAVRIDEPVVIDRFAVTETRDPNPPRTLVELVLRGGAADGRSPGGGATSGGAGAPPRHHDRT